MKRIKSLVVLLLLLATLISMTSCYFISSQTMDKLEGTYKLTSYTYTPKHERKEGYTPKRYDYVNDEEYKYEDYLVITGTGTGYYVHKDAKGECYVKEVTLSYEYSTDNPGKIDYVTYNDSISVNQTGGIHRMGVAKGNLNYNKQAIDYTELFTKRPMRTEALSVRWEKVSKATDLSYVRGQVVDMKTYSYKAFALRGIYELTEITNATDSEMHSPRYSYYYVLIDTAEGKTTATVCYSPADEPNTQYKRTVNVTHADDFSWFVIDGVNWTLLAGYTSRFSSFEGDRESHLTLINNDSSEAGFAEFIKDREPEIIE